MIRISPTSYHIVPRALPRSWSVTADQHKISPDCPIRCLSNAIGAPVLRVLTRSLSDRFPSRILTAADVLALYREDELASPPGIGRRQHAVIERGLITAGLITRTDWTRNCRGKARRR